MMKKLKLVLTSLTVLGLVACNSGSNSGGDQPQPPKPDPTPTRLESLPYTYTTNHSMGESGGLPIIDLRPYASSAATTFTFTNPYKESSIWFDSSTGNRIGVPSETKDVQIFTNQQVINANSCKSYTRDNQLPAGQSCTSTQTIIGVQNTSNSEDLELIKDVYYHMDDVRGPDGFISGGMYAKAYAKAGIWYHDLPNYSILLMAFHVVNENGNDYWYQTRGAESPQIGKIRLTFDESGVPQVNYNNIESCTLIGCVNGIIPANGYNIYSLTTPENTTIGIGAYDVFYYANYALKALDNTFMARECDSFSTYCPYNTFSQIYAVQADGTIVGNNPNGTTNGTIGCANRDGSNFRAITLPEGVVLNGGYAGNTSINTITSAHSNWIRGFVGGAQFFYKVIADTSGVCALDGNEPLYDGATTFVSGGVPQQNQITPHGVYGFTGMSSSMWFYKYLPRE